MIYSEGIVHDKLHDIVICTSNVMYNVIICITIYHDWV